MHYPLDVDTEGPNRNSLRDMNQALVSIAVAMIVPAVAVIYVVVLERKSVPEEPITPEIVITTPIETPVAVVTRRRWRWS